MLIDKEDEARMYLTDNTVATPTLSALATVKNTTVAELRVEMGEK